MKKKVVSIMLCAAMVTALAVGCGGAQGTDTAAPAGGDAAPAGSAEAEPAGDAGGSGADLSALDNYDLIVQSHDPENSATGQFLNDWAESVNKASDGHLNIQVYHGATLGGPKDTIDMIKNGTCDIGWGLQSFYDGQFPVTEVFSLPMIDIESAVQGSNAIWDFYNNTDYMAAEYADYEVLLLHTNCQSPISTTSKKIEKVEDLAALQVRGNAGPPTTFITDFGGTPASCPINDLYSNLEKGVYGGVITDWHAISSFKLNEVLSYYLDENVGVSTYFLLMNKDKYASLPAELQTILKDTTADAIQYTDAWETYAKNIKDEITAADPEAIYKLSDEEHAKLKDVAQKTIDSWIAETPDGQAIYDAAMESIANAAK